MDSRRSSPSAFPHMDAADLRIRLASICQALGASRVGLARRLAATASGPTPFELLAGADPAGDDPAEPIPLAAFLSLLWEGRLLEVAPDQASVLGRWLRKRGEARILGFPLPEDERPSILLVAVYHEERRVGEQRLRVSRAGMDALARALAPPPWLPLTPIVEPTSRTGEDQDSGVSRLLSDLVPLPDAVAMVERVMLRRALRVSEGNKAAAARHLRMSRQGLYKKLRQHGML